MVDLAPEPGWQPLPPPVGLQSFVSGDPEGDRLRVRYYLDTDGALVGKVWFGPGAQGPPGHAHGGSMAAVLDEGMGGAAWIAGHRVLAARLTTAFHKMLPLGSVVSMHTSIAATNGRKITMRGALYAADGDLVCDAEGLFLEIELERMDASQRQALRQAMAVFGRGPLDEG